MIMFFYETIYKNLTEGKDIKENIKLLHEHDEFDINSIPLLKKILFLLKILNKQEEYKLCIILASLQFTKKRHNDHIACFKTKNIDVFKQLVKNMIAQKELLNNMPIDSRHQ